MPSQKRTKGVYYGERRGGFMRAMSLAVFNSKLWLCDPLAGYHKAGEGRRAAQDELQDMTWVEVQWMNNQANRTEMWIPRVNLLPPHLDPQFEIPSSFMQTPMTTPTPSSLPSPPSSDGGCADVEGSNPDTGNRVASEKMPSGGRNGSRVCMAAVVAVGVATAMCVVAGRGGTGKATASEVVTVRAVAVEAAATGTAETVAAVWATAGGGGVAAKPPPPPPPPSSYFSVCSSSNCRFRSTSPSSNLESFHFGWFCW